jgi:hypothetical protein
VKAKPDLAGAARRLDGATVTVAIPVTIKRCGGRKVLIAADGRQGRGMHLKERTQARPME